MSEYNPEPDIPIEEEKKKSSGLTKIDRWVIAGAFIALGLLLLPVYFKLREQMRFQQCQQNLKKIGQALKQYASDNGEGLPSAYPLRIPGIEGESPPAWIFTLHPYLKIKSGENSPFICMTADKAGNAFYGIGENKIECSYGFFTGLSGAQEKDLPDKGSTVVIADTVTGGKLDSYNPMPLGANDGSIIGLDDTNAAPTAQSKFITRLAIKRIDKNKGWDIESNLYGRHDQMGINALFLDGHVEAITPGDMILHRDIFGSIFGRWKPAQKKQINP